MSIQFRNITKLALNTSESVSEHVSRANFGVSSFLALKLWDLLQPIHDLHVKYRPQYLLWTLLFLKQYSSDDVSLNTVGVPVKTFCQWVWPIIDEISSRANQVVSKKSFKSLTNCFYYFFNFGSFFPNGSRIILKVSVSCWLKAQTFAFLNLHHLIANGSLTGSMAPPFNMRLLSLSKGAKYVGSMDLFLQESSVISKYFAVALSSCFFHKKG